MGPRATFTIDTSMTIMNWVAARRTSASHLRRVASTGHLLLMRLHVGVSHLCTKASGEVLNEHRRK